MCSLGCVPLMNVMAPSKLKARVRFYVVFVAAAAAANATVVAVHRAFVSSDFQRISFPDLHYILVVLAHACQQHTFRPVFVVGFDGSLAVMVSLLLFLFLL